MSITARYPGVCPECEGRWQPGDLITHDGRTSLSEPFAWRHVVCPDDDPLTADHPVCQTCWLTHPEGACDR